MVQSTVPLPRGPLISSTNTLAQLTPSARALSSYPFDNHSPLGLGTGPLFSPSTSAMKWLPRTQHPPRPLSRPPPVISRLICSFKLILHWSSCLRSFSASKSSPVLVGYAAIDGPTGFRKAMAEFLTCDPSGGGSGSTAIDLYGFNN